MKLFFESIKKINITVKVSFNKYCKICIPFYAYNVYFFIIYQHKKIYMASIGLDILFSLT